MSLPPPCVASAIRHIDRGNIRAPSSLPQLRRKLCAEERLKTGVVAGPQNKVEDPMSRTLLASVAGLTMVAGVSLSFAAPAQDRASKTFLRNAIEGNYAEIQMGQLAQQKGQSDGVKSFGQMLVTDHSDANRKALDAAKQIGLEPPSGPSAQQQADYDRMSKLAGSSFDNRFARDIVADHRKDIREYQQEARRDDAAGQYAKDSLPTLEKHLQTATSLEGGR
jgi:putative membrane protein